VIPEPSAVPDGLAQPPALSAEPSCQLPVSRASVPGKAGNVTLEIGSLSPRAAPAAMVPGDNIPPGVPPSIAEVDTGTSSTRAGDCAIPAGSTRSGDTAEETGGVVDMVIEHDLGEPDEVLEEQIGDVVGYQAATISEVPAAMPAVTGASSNVREQPIKSPPSRPPPQASEPTMGLTPPAQRLSPLHLHDDDRPQNERHPTAHAELTLPRAPERPLSPAPPPPPPPELAPLLRTSSQSRSRQPNNEIPQVGARTQSSLPPPPLSPPPPSPSLAPEPPSPDLLPADADEAPPPPPALARADSSPRRLVAPVLLRQHVPPHSLGEQPLEEEQQAPAEHGRERRSGVCMGKQRYPTCVSVDALSQRTRSESWKKSVNAISFILSHWLVRFPVRTSSAAAVGTRSCFARRLSQRWPPCAHHPAVSLAGSLTPAFAPAALAAAHAPSSRSE